MSSDKMERRSKSWEEGKRAPPAPPKKTRDNISGDKKLKATLSDSDLSAEVCDIEILKERERSRHKKEESRSKRSGKGKEARSHDEDDYDGNSAIKAKDWQELHRALEAHISEGLPRREYSWMDDESIRNTQARVKDFSEAKIPANSGKNRYGNILPYNQTRVKLSSQGFDGDDYINASYVTVNEMLPALQWKMKYIAACAPLPATMKAFYKMLWESNAFAIVCLTKNEESGKVKAHRYWPEEGKKSTHGDIIITTESTTENKKFGFITRVLRLSKGSEKRTITQYHYLAWPDHGVPDTAGPLEEMIEQINELYRKETSGGGKRKGSGGSSGKGSSDNLPTLITHCSAGIGRTGTFIMVHSLLNLLFQDLLDNDSDAWTKWSAAVPPTVDFMALTRHMRDQRTCMISQVEQYEFCYQTILDNLERVINESMSSPSSRGKRGKSGSKVTSKSCALF